MPIKPITPVILSGGLGSRLWPLSRKNLPKQFALLVGDQSLFERTLARVDGDRFSAPLIVASDDHRFHVLKQLKSQSFKRNTGSKTVGNYRAGDIILEPSGKNTAPAVLAAALHMRATGSKALMLVLPSDHLIPNAEEFADAISAGTPAALGGDIVVFGITPIGPETAYGYIKVDRNLSGGSFPVKFFHEKPTLECATAMLTEGGYYWNAGIFLIAPNTVLELAAKFQPEMLKCVSDAFANAERDGSFIRPDAAKWEKVPSDSIDYALAEKASKISCVPFTGSWSDLGDWKSLASVENADTSGNRLYGEVTALDCSDTVLWSVDDRTHLVGLGLDGIIAVATEDAIMVADANNVQDVRNVVTTLQEGNILQGFQHSRDYRPWGWFDCLVIVPGYQVKRLHVEPGMRLSLQSHKHRSEHWVVVDGTATVVLDDEELLVEPNQSVYIHAGQKHRLSNMTKSPLTVIEVQVGSYLGEDDILRYGDDFNRT